MLSPHVSFVGLSVPDKSQCLSLARREKGPGRGAGPGVRTVFQSTQGVESRDNPIAGRSRRRARRAHPVWFAVLRASGEGTEREAAPAHPGLPGWPTHRPIRTLAGLHSVVQVPTGGNESGFLLSAQSGPMLRRGRGPARWWPRLPASSPGRPRRSMVRWLCLRSEASTARVGELHP